MFNRAKRFVLAVLVGCALVLVVPTTSIADLTFYCDETGCYSWDGTAWVPVAEDNDGDGYQSSVDCDDTNPAIHPNAVDVPGNDIDENCDGHAVCYADGDGDGHGSSVLRDSLDLDCTPNGGELIASTNGDCDDANPAINPGAVDVPGNDIDENCDGHAVCYADDDHDGYGTFVVRESLDTDCIPNSPVEGISSNSSDCDDTNAARNPSATEVCDPDNVDEDCNGLANDVDFNAVGKATFYQDADGDGYGDPSVPVQLCAAIPGTSSNNTDCDDSHAAIYPNATEIPGDGIDENCDGRELCFVDADHDHYGASTLVLSDPGDLTCAQPGVAHNNADCNDNQFSIHPNAEDVPGNSIDENCDGQDAAAAPPVANILSGPSFSSNDAVAEFTFSSPQAGVTFECALDGTTFGACSGSGSHTTGTLVEGEHTFEVRAVDQTAGAGAPTGYSWIVDLTSPQTTLVRLGDTPSGSIVSFILSASEPATFECDLDSAGFVPCSSDFTTPTLTGGQHTLLARAIDQAGNADPTPASEIWLVDADDDGDGYTSDDCDDGDPMIHPNAPEICSDAADNDCDSQVDCLDPDCAGDATCPSPCFGGPFSCKSPGVTKLELRNTTPDDGDKIGFRWTLGDETSAAELGDPTVDTSYAVCVWDEVAGAPVLVMEMVAPPAGNCVGRPCWRAAGDGFRYRDPGHLPSGVDKMKVQAGPFGKSSIKVTGRGLQLPDPPMPFKQDPHITVQVVNSLGTCWGADYVSPAQLNTDTRLEVKEKP